MVRRRLLLSGCGWSGQLVRCLVVVGVSERVQVWLPADALEVAKVEAGSAGVSVNRWLEDAAEAHVELQRALREMEAQERAHWSGWHPNDRLADDLAAAG